MLTFDFWLLDTGEQYRLTIAELRDVFAKWKPPRRTPALPLNQQVGLFIVGRDQFALASACKAADKEDIVRSLNHVIRY